VGVNNKNEARGRCRRKGKGWALRGTGLHTNIQKKEDVGREKLRKMSLCPTNLFRP